MQSEYRVAGTAGKRTFEMQLKCRFSAGIVNSSHGPGFSAPCPVSTEGGDQSAYYADTMNAVGELKIPVAKTRLEI